MISTNDPLPGFERLVREQRPRLLNVARRMLANEDDAQDAVQDALVSAVKGVDRFSGRSSLGTWLYRIQVNCCLMALRRRRARPEFPFGDLPDPRVSREPSAAREIERRETVRAVRAGIDRLPDPFRRILVMREIQGIATRDAARALDVTPNTIKTRLYRAKRALRAELEPEFGFAKAG